MPLLFTYLACMIAGDVLAYLIGLAVERVWGQNVSLVVFLTLYFVFLGVAWVVAVWITKPRAVQTA